MNKVFLIGRLGKDPEFKELNSGQVVCSLSLATGESWKDDKGEKQERTEWHRVIVWGAQAKACAQYLKKGSQVSVEGKVETREWENKRSGGKSWITEIKSQHVEFLGGKTTEDSKPTLPVEQDNSFDESFDNDAIPF